MIRGVGRSYVGVGCAACIVCGHGNFDDEPTSVELSFSGFKYRVDMPTMDRPAYIVASDDYSFFICENCWDGVEHCALHGQSEVSPMIHNVTWETAASAGHCSFCNSAREKELHFIHPDGVRITKTKPHMVLQVVGEEHTVRFCEFCWSTMKQEVDMLQL